MSTETPTKTNKRKEEMTRDPYPKRQKRVAMQAKRYSPSRYIKPEWEPTRGSGTLLSDITIIEDHLKQVSRNEDFLKQIHLLMYSHVAKTKDVKKNIGAFNGFTKDYDAADKQVYIENKLLTRGQKFLVQMYLFLGLKGLGTTDKKELKKKTAEDLAEEIFEFLESPAKSKVGKKKTDFSLVEKKKKATKSKKSAGKGKGKGKGKEKKEEDSSDEESKSEGESKGTRKSKRTSVRGGSKSEDEDEKKGKAEEKKGTKRKNSVDKSRSDTPTKKAKSGKEKKGSSSSTTQDLRSKLETGQFLIQYAADGRTKCADKDCKEQIKSGEVRICRASGSEKSDEVTLKFYHPECLFKAQKRFRGGAIVEGTDDLIDFKKLDQKDQNIVSKAIKKYKD